MHFLDFLFAVAFLLFDLVSKYNWEAKAIIPIPKYYYSWMGQCEMQGIVGKKNYSRKSLNPSQSKRLRNLKFEKKKVMMKDKGI